MPFTIPSESTGKDTVTFVSRADHLQRSSVTLADPEKPPCLILPSGEINWMCPCLDRMTTGPCGVQFREAFSCFHYSKAFPQGSNCLGLFQSLQECMQQYPQTYIKEDVPIPKKVEKRKCLP